VLAGDGRETAIAEDESPMVLNDRCRKVFKLPDGQLFGASKGSEDGTRLYEALTKKLPPPKLECVNALRIDLKGRIWLYEGNIWQRITIPYYAIGSGSIFAMAAMDAGASAIEAAKIGAKRDVYSGGKVTFVRLAKLPKK
jgi:hypothetical protein